MGTPDFFVPALKALVGAGHDVAVVVTQPDKPKGRGKEMQMTPVKIQAPEYKISVYQPVKVEDGSFVKALWEMEADVFVVMAFGQVLPGSVLDLPGFGCVDIHASPLPKYRGVASIQWCVVGGEKETGITTMIINMGLDIGDMLGKAVIPIDRDEIGGGLHDRLSLAGGELILSTLKKMEEGIIVRTPQTEEGVCCAKMLTRSLGGTDWEKSTVSIERLIRGLNPWPSVYTIQNEKNIKIWFANVLGKGGEEEATRNVPSLDGVPSGTVVCSGKRSLVVKTGEGLLSIEELQMGGKKRMDTDVFLWGYPVHEGDILTRETEQHGSILECTTDYTIKRE